MATSKFISAARLRELLLYDPSTGLFLWLQDRGTRKVKGLVAGSLNSNGYVEITVDGGRYWCHRLAWLYVHGQMPHEIDHLNGQRNDNRIANLRDVSHQVNIHNAPVQSIKNATGAKGVRRHRAGLFCAEIWSTGVRHHLGTFDTIAAASEAYKAAKSRLHAPAFR